MRNEKRVDDDDDDAGHERGDDVGHCHDDEPTILHVFRPEYYTCRRVHCGGEGQGGGERTGRRTKGGLFQLESLVRIVSLRTKKRDVIGRDLFSSNF